MFERRLWCQLQRGQHRIDSSSRNNLAPLHFSNRIRYHQHIGWQSCLTLQSSLVSTNVMHVDMNSSLHSLWNEFTQFYSDPLGWQSAQRPSHGSHQISAHKSGGSSGLLQTFEHLEQSQWIECAQCCEALQRVTCNYYQLLVRLVSPSSASSRTGATCWTLVDGTWVNGIGKPPSRSKTLWTVKSKQKYLDTLPSKAYRNSIEIKRSPWETCSWSWETMLQFQKADGRDFESLTAAWGPTCFCSNYVR